ncbi:TPA: SPOR domain-containing protein [Stenotrophomonas maltophilia]|uniref:SPOR domain-containing protein n=1 Tax=Stenotrophomonas TaxID=40323 RepID=UPI00244B577E|nr:MULTISPECIES: SPOR domain-containing protein [Stenotrophomonas]MBN5025732.1 SPOR domain-containing protein [Stenotrophomonas maltophilia]MDH1483597.1 SPOR domain-containing protein [Stenotrophomonas sp. GD03712]WON69537.1 SPOR domain-containing protein [Stenotrophomonas maltophilia]HDS1101018.1 SPOR domain-containing protein [Stenotrophomonas maltophilia]HDS1107154.1 SPOR domain-containing protein [Stenotrophomonas maltophilia]
MDTPLKQRLIGAIVLVALAVIFLPMLVKGPAPDSGVANVPIAAPDAPADGQFETRELPLVAPAGGATGLQSGQARPLADAAAPATPPTVDTSPAVAAGNYAVTFGAYGSKADADAVIAHLQRSQLPGFSETTTLNGRQAWRVRVGPYADRAQAEAGRLQAVKIRSDVKAEVITLDAATGSTAAATPAPAAPSASTPAAATAPSANGNPVRSETLPPSTTTATTAPAAKPEPPKPAPKPEAPKPEATASKPAAAPVTPAAPAAAGVGFAVQLGAFGRANDANALRDKVRAAGFSAFVEQVRTEKGTLHRVRVGPVANRADAEQLKAQVAAKVGVAGMVRPHP